MQIDFTEGELNVIYKALTTCAESYSDKRLECFKTGEMDKYIFFKQMASTCYIARKKVEQALTGETI